MSIWGPGPFDNDDGADWFTDLQAEPSLESIREALDELSAPGHVGYLDVTDGAEAVAAAEVLAELLGAPGDDPVFDDELQEQRRVLREALRGEGRRELQALLKRAIDALDIVFHDTENSELRQMWDEQADMMPAWAQAMASLQQRLQKLAAG